MLQRNNQMLCNKDAGKLLGRYISTVRTYTYIVVEENPGKNIFRVPVPHAKGIFDVYLTTIEVSSDKSQKYSLVYTTK